VKIAIIASEGMPYAKTGGLADVIGSLPIEIQAMGHSVAVFLPRYKSVDIQKWELKQGTAQLTVPMGTEKETARLYTANHPGGLRFYFIDRPEYFCREELYGTPLGDYPDNDHRFIFFQRGVLEALRVVDFKPDILHCHDWQTGLIPAYLKTLYANDAFFKKTKSVFTIHNLAYQGNFPPDSLSLTGLGWDQYKIDRLEYYGKISFLKGGIVYADLVTTVSERYSREIQTKEFGCGFEGIFAKRRNSLHGIVNGIDYMEWNPETDPDIPAQYSLKNLEKKAVNKKELQKENELAMDPSAPLFGMVSRLVDQKGIDILIPALAKILEMGGQFVLLGTGEEKYHQLFREMAKKNKGQIGIHILFDPKMAKRIYAGCDTMLIPSYYEPCGLAQMIALRYGTIPAVRLTGGLADTIQEFNPKTGEGNGFGFEDYTSDALVETLKRSIAVFEDKKNWRAVMKNAMESDFSWTASAKKYVKLFEEMEPRKIGTLGRP
jgi:starch synthase